MHLNDSLIFDISYSIIVMQIISKMQKILLQNFRGSQTRTM